MTTYIGNNGVVKTAADGDTVAALTEITSFTVESTSDVIETSAMGSLARTYKAGMNTFTLTFAFLYDPADAEQERLTVVGTDIDFEVYPQGTTEGASEDKNYFSGGAIVTGATIETTVDGVVTMNVTAQGSGALTITPIA
jgi:predicted secreted protein